MNYSFTNDIKFHDTFIRFENENFINYKSVTWSSTFFTCLDISLSCKKSQSHFILILSEINQSLFELQNIERNTWDKVLNNINVRFCWKSDSSYVEPCKQLTTTLNDWQPRRYVNQINVNYVSIQEK